MDGLIDELLVPTGSQRRPQQLNNIFEPYSEIHNPVTVSSFSIFYSILKSTKYLQIKHQWRIKALDSASQFLTVVAEVRINAPIPIQQVLLDLQVSQKTVHLPHDTREPSHWPVRHIYTLINRLIRLLQRLFITDHSTHINYWDGNSLWLINISSVVFALSTDFCYFYAFEIFILGCKKCSSIIKKSPPIPFSISPTILQRWTCLKFDASQWLKQFP